MVCEGSHHGETYAVDEHVAEIPDKSYQYLSFKILIKNITMKFPKYSVTNLLEAIARTQMEESISKSLTNTNTWYRVTDYEYVKFIRDWSGQPLDCVKAHNCYSWVDMNTYYVYTTESRRVLARIEHSVSGIEYYLALNA